LSRKGTLETVKQVTSAKPVKPVKREKPEKLVKTVKPGKTVKLVLQLTYRLLSLTVSERT